jgi:hypothetical protein
VRAFALESTHIVDQYEALRREAIEADSGGAVGHGLALFLYRGMTAWISALSVLARRPMAGVTPQEGSLRRLTVELPPAIRCDLTAVMADMVLACYG